MKQNKKRIFLIVSLVVIILAVGSYILYTSQSNGFNPSEMIQAEEIVPPTDVTLELTKKGGRPVLTLTNQSQKVLYHGNVYSTLLQVFLDGKWYYMDTQPVQTLEGYFLQPGQTYSSSFYWSRYGDLPDGTYRLVFEFSYMEEEPHIKEEQEDGFAVVEFSVQDSNPIYP